MKKRSRWDATPVPGGGGDGEEGSGAGSAMATPLTGSRLADGSDTGLATPGISQTPGATPLPSDVTPGVTPLAMTGERESLFSSFCLTLNLFSLHEHCGVAPFVLSSP